jgi:hypothetical protein
MDAGPMKKPRPCPSCEKRKAAIKRLGNKWLKALKGKKA